MGDVIVGIHQPNFFPWFGYFLKIARSDEFVFLDDAQISNSSSYVNRSSININGKAKWLTVPIQRAHGRQTINKTKYLDTSWRTKVIKTLKMNYGTAQHYNENEEFIHTLINYSSNCISEFNIFIISEICKVLDLSTSICVASALTINNTSTERLITIVKSLNGNIYLSGSGGNKYQDIDLFESNFIKVQYNLFSHPIYNQAKTNTFIKGLSILDFIFNIGIKNTKLFLNNSLLYN